MKGNAWEAGWVRKELALIISLIYAREEEGAIEARLNKLDQSRSNLSADKFVKLLIFCYNYSL